MGRNYRRWKELMKSLGVSRRTLREYRRYRRYSARRDRIGRRVRADVSSLSPHKTRGIFGR